MNVVPKNKACRADNEKGILPKLGPREFRVRRKGRLYENTSCFEFASAIVASGENKPSKVRNALARIAKDELELALECPVVFVGVVRVHQVDRFLVDAGRGSINRPAAAPPHVHHHRAAVVRFGNLGFRLFLAYRVGHFWGFYQTTGMPVHKNPTTQCQYRASQ
jgi:hypothetical protein